jgi:hypothetical protein
MDRDRTREEQARLDAIVDNLGPTGVFAMIVRHFGFKRAVQLVGWLVVWEFQGKEGVTDIRKELERAGMKRTNAFRAARELSEFAEDLSSVCQERGLPVPRDVREVAEVVRRAKLEGGVFAE